MKHIALIANKWWEADPLCAVLLNERARPADIKDVTAVRFPTQRPLQKPSARPNDPDPLPRLTLGCAGVSVDVWCLEELMNPYESSSSSAEKARVLTPALASRTNPDLVVAFGTAGSRPGVSANGCVVIGGRVFVHDPFASQPDRTGMWTPPNPNVVIPSTFTRWSKINPEARYSAEARFIPTPIAPATPPVIAMGNGFISLGVVNVLNYDQYVWADEQAVSAIKATEIRDGQIGSVETTHGVIRAAHSAPFIYVSGIVDMEGVFDYHVMPRVYSQNMAGAHNAAVATSFLLPEFARLI